MTRAQFEAKAIRAAEYGLCLPPGWWGTWTDVHAPFGVRVRFTRACCWVISARGKTVSKHDSRAYAISKAQRLGK